MKTPAVSCRPIIAMAHALHKSVVAEGVGDRRQAEPAAHLGLNEAQGYYFSRPVTAAALEALMDKTTHLILANDTMAIVKA